MPGTRQKAIWAGLETLYFTGTHRLARSLVGGIGAILMFHRVLPQRDDPFQPNRGLEIEPGFLDEALAALKQADVDIVSIGEAARRLSTGAGGRRFVVVTFDDGYRDTLEFAWPVLKRHAVPFTLYVASAFADGTGTLWWDVLETVVARNETIRLEMDGEERAFDCATPQAKERTFGTIYWWLRESAREADLRRAIATLVDRYGIDAEGRCRELCMGWRELAELAGDPLVTIGAHTVSHPFLAKCDEETVRAEMIESRRRIEEKLGVVAEHFAYPVGAPDAAGPREFRIAGDVGFTTAVTTRPGVVFADHRDHLTALPRISVNGEFQRLRFIDVLLSGAPTALLNGFRRVDAA